MEEGKRDTLSLSRYLQNSAVGGGPKLQPKHPEYHGMRRDVMMRNLLLEKENGTRWDVNGRFDSRHLQKIIVDSYVIYAYHQSQISQNSSGYGGRTWEDQGNLSRSTR